MSLLFAALWWLFLTSMACSTAVVVLAVFFHLRDLLHSEEQEGRAAAGGQAPLVSLAAARALGNAEVPTGAPGLDKARRSQVFTVQQPREVSCSSVVVELDARRIRRANRGRCA